METEGMTDTDGVVVGATENEGVADGDPVGMTDGTQVGSMEGKADGLWEGGSDGRRDGRWLGVNDGAGEIDGNWLGETVRVGFSEGVVVGDGVVGLFDGDPLGWKDVGAVVGSGAKTKPKGDAVGVEVVDMAMFFPSAFLPSVQDECFCDPPFYSFCRSYVIRPCSHPTVD